MTRAVLAFVLCLVANSAIAQSIVVRSGEHGDFTRVVFDIAAGTGWDLTDGSDGNTALLKLDMPSAEFDTSAAFNKIDRSRVSRLQPIAGKSEIEIQFACECETKAFVLRDRMLVIDIRHKLVNGEVPDSIYAEPNPNKINLIDTDLAKLWLGNGSRIGPKKEVPPFVIASGLVPLAPVNPDDQNVVAQEKPDPRDVRGQVLGDVANAATQGLLLASPSHWDQQSLEKAEEPETDVPVAHVAQVLEHELPEKGHVSIGGRQCVSDDRLNIAKWESGVTNVSLSLATRRSAVFGEFDKVNVREMTDYAKSLIYFGFGAEARSVLSGINAETDASLLTMSYLVDGDDDPTHFFQQQVSCEGAAALWAALDGSGLSENSELHTSLLLQAFELLPSHLRENLGPRLAQNLANNGFKPLARDVLRRLERMSGEETDRIALGKAEIDLLDGNSDKAEVAFQELTKTETPDTPRAIAATVEIAQSKGEPVSDRIVELTAAYSTELRNTDGGPELWEAHLRSLFINKRFDEALEVLNKVEGVPEELLTNARNETFSAVFKTADDVTFLKFFFQELPKLETPLNEEHVLFAANRVLNLGLPEAAMAAVSTIVDPKLSHAKKLVQAHALVELERPDEAEILLIGLDGSDVDFLRAQARSRMGDHDYAQDIYSDLGEDEAERQEAWLSGNWSSLAENEEGPLSQAARMIQQDPAAVQDGGVTLRDAETLFNASAEARNTIQGMLDATRLDAIN